MTSSSSDARTANAARFAARFATREVTPEATDAFDAGDRRVGVLSYGWLTRPHPDPRGERAAHVIVYLNSPTGLSFEALFWDFGCVPEPDASGYISDDDLARQQKAFGHMNAL